MSKRSNLLIAIAIMLFIFIGISSIVMVYLTKNIENTALVINHSAIVRGTIQRIVKLEIESKGSDELLNKVDQMLESIISSCNIGNDDKSYASLISNLNVSWINLKKLILANREKPSEYYQSSLIEESEKLWKESDSLVNMAHDISKRRVSYFNILTIFLVLNMILVSLIILLLRSYVQNKLEFSANHDQLTGIYNRAFLHDYMLKQLKVLERYKGSMSFILFDIDHFKKVNDTYGHDIGDYVLKELTRIVNENIRTSDVLVRVGGEEFLIVASNTNQQSAMLLAEKLRELVAAYSFNHIGQATISLGISEYRQGDTFDTLFKRCDNALYKAKNNGRNRSESE